MKKFLAVDIGNTSIHFALRKGKAWTSHFSITTNASEKAVRALLIKKRALVRGAEAAIASVVPAKSVVLKKIFRGLGIRAYLIGKDIPVPVKNLYRNPRQVGVDRLLNALAAYRLYKKELIVIDFGTAITFDVVNRSGAYLGGVIAPGIEISLEALFNKTALLPKIRLAHPREWIGKDTVESIRVGCSVGIGGLCDRTVEAVSHKYRLKPMVVATGGYASFMKRYCHTVRRIVPNLILDGILACTMVSLSNHQKNPLLVASQDVRSL